MLTLTYKNSGIEYFNMGDFYTISHRHIKEVSHIEATGFELDKIKALFCTNKLAHPDDRHYTIPMTDKSKVSWYGSIAKNILINLQYD